jgi:hypothetical protein
MNNMKRLNISFTSAILLILIAFIFGGCKKPEALPYTYGTFPDSIFNMEGINSQYDDYNLNIDQTGAGFVTIFSSNRNTNGAKFDLVTGFIEFTFDMRSGQFTLNSDMINDPFTNALTNAANTAGDDFGPYRMISRNDSHEYLITTTESTNGTLDLYYLKYIPYQGGIIPVFTNPEPVSNLNSSANDGYITFDISQNLVFFCSDRGGDFDIYTANNNIDIALSDWFALDPITATEVDSINSDYDDKCPIISRNVMVFTSNRPGGMGGYDLYYSVYKEGNWGSAINFGPGINSEANEYRPVLGYHPEFTNYFLVFSSDRTGGKGGYDLYFTGVDIPDTPALISK